MLWFRAILMRQTLSLTWWRHQMETFSALLALCAGIYRSIPSKRPVTRSFDALFAFAPWINGWINNREAGGFRRHRAHYDVSVMTAPLPLFLASLVRWRRWLLWCYLGLLSTSTECPLWTIWTILNKYEFSTIHVVTSHIFPQITKNNLV